MSNTFNVYVLGWHKVFIIFRYNFVSCFPKIFTFFARFTAKNTRNKDNFVLKNFSSYLRVILWQWRAAFESWIKNIYSVQLSKGCQSIDEKKLLIGFRLTDKKERRHGKWRFSPSHEFIKINFPPKIFHSLCADLFMHILAHNISLMFMKLISFVGHGI